MNYTCQECETDFSIQQSGFDPVSFCPFCGVEIEVEEDDLDEE
jgi:rRNA maturation endonuclease Nob1